MSLYNERIRKIEKAFGRQFALPAGRSFLRYEHGPFLWRARHKYRISVQWMHTRANYLTGRVHSTVLGIGSDFDKALAHAGERRDHGAFLWQDRH